MWVISWRIVAFVLGARRRGLLAVEALEHLDLAELRHDRLDCRVEVEPSLLDELQRAGRRDRLGHRRVPEHRVGPAAPAQPS